MRPDQRRTPWLAALCIAIIGLGCSSAGPAQSSPAAPGQVQLRPPGQTFETFERLVQALPNYDGDIFQLIVIDWRQTLYLGGQQWPENCADTPPEDYARSMSQAVRATSAPWSVPMQSARVEPEAWHTEFGIRLCEILGTARTTERLSTTLVLQVDAAAQAIEEAVTTDPIWSDDLTSELIGDLQIYSWGDGTQPDRASGARNIGQAGHLGIRDDIVVRTDFRRSLDGFVGGESMANRPHIIEVLEILAAERVAAAVLTETPDLGTQSSVPPVRFMPWEFLGFGTGMTNAGAPSVTIVMAHQNEADAMANTARFTDVAEWSRLLDVVDARSTGNYSITTVVASPDATISAMEAARIGFDEGLFLPQPG